jgi:hypothetical protein
MHSALRAVLAIEHTSLPPCRAVLCCAVQVEAKESELRATLIEYNLDQVDAAINAVNSAIATGALPLAVA